MPPHRKKRRLTHVVGVGRFLTFSCYRRQTLLTNDKIRKLLVDKMTAASVRFDVAILAWVIMPEHVHLIVFAESPDGVTDFQTMIKASVARTILNRWRKAIPEMLRYVTTATGETHFWQAGGGYDRDVISEELLEKIRYCHRNPVTRGLCESPIDWPWSSARAYEHATDAGPPIAFDLLPRTSDPLT